jgi:hypothetical protein
MQLYALIACDVYRSLAELRNTVYIRVILPVCIYSLYSEFLQQLLDQSIKMYTN